jgi:hypothetical protein
VAVNDPPDVGALAVDGEVYRQLGRGFEVPVRVRYGLDLLTLRVHDDQLLGSEPLLEEDRRGHQDPLVVDLRGDVARGAAEELLRVHHAGDAAHVLAHLPSVVAAVHGRESPWGWG